MKNLTQMVGVTGLYLISLIGCQSDPAKQARIRDLRERNATLRLEENINEKIRQLHLNSYKEVVDALKLRKKLPDSLDNARVLHIDITEHDYETKYELLLGRDKNNNYLVIIEMDLLEGIRKYQNIKER